MVWFGRETRVRGKAGDVGKSLSLVSEAISRSEDVELKPSGGELNCEGHGKSKEA